MVRALAFCIWFMGALGVALDAVLILGYFTRSAKADERCLASVYYHGKRTANGEFFRPFRNLTAAHRRHPFGTVLQVTHRKNGRTVLVRVNDRGPFIRGRCVDLTPLAAKWLGMGITTFPVTVGRVGRRNRG